ncbi:hypothetical protein L596_017178 [Steinernema carpocapsae]|uniref:Uncharacterized protein n=1 Tax=Steinernema carpocapsae TaxID=34508 RepID=A0A4U5N122_STECR|nr:hypothetical protein L596_017178 [Steinernema carpocapsae]
MIANYPPKEQNDRVQGLLALFAAAVPTVRAPSAQSSTPIIDDSCRLELFTRGHYLFWATQTQMGVLNVC